MKMFQQNQGIFFLLLETTDCKDWPLGNEGHSCLREFKFCLRDREGFSAATAFLGLWVPGHCSALGLVFPT